VQLAKVVMLMLLSVVDSFKPVGLGDLGLSLVFRPLSVTLIDPELGWELRDVL